MIKVLYTQLTQIHHFETISSRICKNKIPSYMKLKKDDHLFVSYAFWTRIRPGTFLKVWPEPGP